MKYSKFSLILVFILFSGFFSSIEVLAQTPSPRTYSLESFLKTVQEQNLDIKMEARKYESAKAEGRGINIPPPSVAAIQFEDDNGSSASGYQISQTLPFPTKLSADSKARKSEAKSQEFTKVAREKEIIAQAKIAYINLWLSQEKLSLLSEKRTALEDHIKLARSTARSDNFASIHLNNSESDLFQLDNDILSAQQDLRSQQVEVAALINTEASTFRPILNEPPISKIPALTDVEATPQIQAQKSKVESLSARESEAKSTWLPDLSLRYKEMAASEMEVGSKEVMVEITLPFLFYWQPSATNQRASAKKSEAQYELDKQRRNLDAIKISLLGKAETLLKQLNNTNEKIIPKVKKRMALVHNLAPRDMETLQDHREAVEALPELKMNTLELRLQYEMAIADLEKLFTPK